MISSNCLGSGICNLIYLSKNDMSYTEVLMVMLMVRILMDFDDNGECVRIPVI